MNTRVPNPSFDEVEMPNVILNGLDVMLELTNFQTAPLSEVIVPCKATDVLLDACSVLKGKLDLQKGPCIAGGLIVRSIQGLNEVNDIDVFARNEDLQSMIGSFGFKWEHDSEAEEHSYARDIFIGSYNGHKVQICVADQEATPTYILAGFDFVHCMFATDGEQVLFHEDAMNLAKNKILRTNKGKIRDIIESSRIWLKAYQYKRLNKFQDLGYRLEVPLRGDTKIE